MARRRRRAAAGCGEAGSAAGRRGQPRLFYFLHLMLLFAGVIFGVDSEARLLRMQYADCCHALPTEHASIGRNQYSTELI